MALVHKTIDVRPEVWKKLRINAELSDVPVRDFLTYLVEKSQPIGPGDAQELEQLNRVKEANRLARST
jgi:hypothetical protein